MRRNYTNVSICLFIAVSAVLFSCHSNNKPSGANAASADSLSKAPQKTAAGPADQDSETYLLPSPLQIASIFKNSGLTYKAGLTATLKDASQFSSTYEQALNMGIYSADLSYCILNKQTDEALKVLKLVKALSDKLGFGSVFESNSFIKRFQDNMNNTDSLAAIIADLQMETDTYLENNQQKYIGVIAFSGAWVESMHIGSKVYEQDKSSALSSRISEQMNILDGLVKLLTRYQGSDSHIAGLMSDLNNIKTAYDSYNEVKSYNPDSEQPVTLTPEHISQLAASLESLRSKFIAS